MNPRSFSEHPLEISKDKRLLQANISCLTETYITLAQNTQKPEQHLSEQQFLQNRLEDKFPSITLGYKHNNKVF